jgi:hypothetical protein
MDSFFSSLDIFDDLHTEDINCCGTVSQNCKGMPRGFDSKTLKLKQDDNTWQGDMYPDSNDVDRQNVHILTNMHRPMAEGNFCDECGKAQKPVTVEDYSLYVGNVEKWDKMAAISSVGWRERKWTKKIIFHLLYLTILNSYIIVIIW